MKYIFEYRDMSVEINETKIKNKIFFSSIKIPKSSPNFSVSKKIKTKFKKLFLIAQYEKIIKDIKFAMVHPEFKRNLGTRDKRNLEIAKYSA